MVLKLFIFTIILSLAVQAGPFKKSAVIDAFKDYKNNQQVVKRPKLIKGSITKGAKPSKIDTIMKNKTFTGSKRLPKESVLTQFKAFRDAQNKKTPKVSKPIVIKRKPKVLMPVTTKKPVTIKTVKPTVLPTKSTTTTFKTFERTPQKVVQSTKPQSTIIKNSNLSTTTKVGNVDAQGKLNVSNINVAKGTEIKNSNIITNVKAKDISVSKGANSDIGSVNIEK